MKNVATKARRINTDSLNKNVLNSRTSRNKITLEEFYKAFCSYLPDSCMNDAPIEIQTHSWKFDSLSFQTITTPGAPRSVYILLQSIKKQIIFRLHYIFILSNKNSDNN